ncbi:O-antigen ligase family protein [Saccharospirillum impatiens]|uniref:O-antigen ligase family protein n=1 Tax=Saccharospirillum impatiens TaxID=169438 RepID=UPI000411C89E|nr:O-antigen ligase family protein [Saccharospirillum impatiens]
MSGNSESRKKAKVDDFYFLKIGPLWKHFWSDHPAFWFLCGYLFFEYFRPQSIYPAINILPWTQILLMGAIVLSVFDKKSKFKISVVHVCIFLLSCQFLFGYFSADYPEWSIEYREFFIQWVVIFIAITYITTTRERFYILLLVFYLCSLKLAYGTALIWVKRGFSFSSFGIMGPPGYFQNSGELAIQMLVFFGLSYYLMKGFFGLSNKWERLILIVGLLAPVMTILGASSRGSQLALVALIIWLVRFRIFKIKYLISLAMISALIVILLPEEQLNRFDSMGEDRTSEQRILYWTRGIEMILDHPFTGVGYYNYIPYFTEHYPDDILFTNLQGERIAELPHNILIQIGTDGGIPALIYYIIIVGYCVFPKTKLDQPFSDIDRGLCLGVLGFFIAGQFVTVGYYPFLWVSAALLVSLRRVGLANQTVSK